ncbi:MAG: nickel-dependent hydrogenase large subunit [Phycisphaerales bacterium]|nr:MAG: nickel-dependent hydrogenase large subunit [Phycisphaerales bacterium]
MATIKIDPMTRIEGHLAIEATVEEGVVTDAKSSGTMFRGFENILKGRSPLDAPHLTQRICGVCPISHGMASCLNLESAYNTSPPANGRILRNLVLGANFIMSHILHFYHLAALDYVNTDGVLGGAIDKGPWQPHYVAPDMVTDPATVALLVGHYVQALEIRRKAHQMGAIFGGKLPCAPTFVPGGCTAVPTAENTAAFRGLLAEQQNFIDNTYIPDVLTVAGAFPAYFGIGSGCGNLLAYGVFDLDNSDQNKLLYRGRYTNGIVAGVDPTQINEDLKYSKYDDAGSGLNPADGVTEPEVGKTGAYSWLKSPRYQGIVHEAGPLARMAVNYLSGDATAIGLIESVLGTNPDISVLFSVLGRHAARALEAKLVADAMDGWLDELDLGQSSYEKVSIPRGVRTGIGLTEAPRGALGHWITATSRGKIDRYQVITPTNWNASPKDDLDQHGPIEQALIGTPVADMDNPIEVLRVVHSFDPCLACSVHMLRPGKEKAEAVVYTRPSI